MCRRLQLIGAAALLAAPALAATGCSEAAADEMSNAQRRVLILGVDGMDPGLLRSLIEQGRMPNFALVASTGTFGPLETSMPPQSPVAWSNVISGTGLLQVAGQQATIREGDAIPIRLNESQSFANQSEKDLELLVIGIVKNKQQSSDGGHSCFSSCEFLTRHVSERAKS